MEEEKLRLDSELKNPLTPAFDASRPTLGDIAAPAFVVAYSDFLCPYCARAAKTMHQLVEKNHGKVKFQFKHFPRITSYNVCYTKLLRGLARDPLRHF